MEFEINLHDNQARKIVSIISYVTNDNSQKVLFDLDPTSHESLMITQFILDNIKEFEKLKEDSYIINFNGFFNTGNNALKYDLICSYKIINMITIGNTELCNKLVEKMKLSDNYLGFLSILDSFDYNNVDINEVYNQFNDITNDH